MMTYEEMYHAYQKLEAADQIRNLVSNYCFEHNCALQMRYYRNWSKREDIRRTTQVLNDVIEAHVRKYPEEWFWLHDRWKSVRDDFSEADYRHYE